jgi:hypothetical protein
MIIIPFFDYTTTTPNIEINSSDYKTLHSKLTVVDYWANFFSVFSGE